jgi:hypothetical protein
MLEAMTDPDVQAAASQPPLSDLRTLASGFRDLAANAAAPPPPPPAPEPAAARAGAGARSSYSSADANVIPPVTVRQDLPAFPGQILVGKTGMLEVLIDETGAVSPPSCVNQ